MKIGDKARWWNRDVPIGRIGLVALLILSLVWVGPYCFAASSNLIWGMSHDWEASYRGRVLKLPLLWRQEEIPNGQATIRLSRAHWWSISLESISIYDSTAAPSNPEERIRFLQNMESKLGGATSAFFPGDKNVAARYMCIESAQHQYGTMHIDCVSKDGRWTAVLNGNDSNVADFQMVLNNLAEMGNPQPL